jgi:hypothetical protein
MKKKHNEDGLKHVKWAKESFKNGGDADAEKKCDKIIEEVEKKLDPKSS